MARPSPGPGSRPVLVHLDARSSETAPLTARSRPDGNWSVLVPQRCAQGWQIPQIVLLLPISQSVPYVHIHLVPRHRKDGLIGFFWPSQRYQDEAALRQMQETLRAAITR